MGSGWIFDSFKNAYIDVAKYMLLSGGVDIPSKIKKMRSVLNVTSSDDKCFLYCLLAKLYPTTARTNTLLNYSEHVTKINMGNVEFPVKIKDIKRLKS